MEGTYNRNQIILILLHNHTNKNRSTVYLVCAILLIEFHQTQFINQEDNVPKGLSEPP